MSATVYHLSEWLGRIDPDEVDRLSAAMQPFLKGHHPAVQGAVLADLFAIWLAGHPEEDRGALVLSAWKAIDKLVDMYSELRNGR